MTSEHEERYFSLDTSYPVPNNYHEHILPDGKLLIFPNIATWVAIRGTLDCDVLKHFIKGFTIRQTFTELSSRYKATDVAQSIQRVLVELEDKKINSTEQPSESHFSKNLGIYLTNACNLRCTHCYRYSSFATNDELTTEEWISVLKDFQKIGGIVGALAILLFFANSAFSIKLPSPTKKVKT